MLLALVGADYKFIWVNTSGEGHQSDGQLFAASELKECIDDNTIDLPDSDPLPNDDRHTLLHPGECCLCPEDFSHETLWQEGSGQ